jgi:hypothetical protein
MKNKSASFKRLSMTVSAFMFTLIGCLPLLIAHAETNEEIVAQTTQQISELLCSNKGRLASCAGQSANDCVDIVTPFVDSCLNQVQFQPSDASGLDFERCFWRNFSIKYGKSFDYSDECYQSANKDAKAIQPLPPELQAQTKSLKELMPWKTSIPSGSADGPKPLDRSEIK